MQRLSRADHSSLTPLTDVEVARIKRVAADLRRREPSPFTARDDQLAVLASYARRSLLCQLETRQRLDQAAAATGSGHWIAVNSIVNDSDGLLTVAALQAFVLDDWPARQRLLLDEDWSPPFGARAGRRGRARTMTQGRVLWAVRSLALRPTAREQLNSERGAGYRGGRTRPQRGHAHAANGQRARGVERADTLAAEEVNRQEDWSGASAIQPRAIAKARADLATRLRA
jgi:hypothetical protein